MTVGMPLVWALLVAGAAFAVRALTRPSEPPAAATRPSPEQVLAERLARAETYRRRVAVLAAADRAGQGPDRSAGG